MAMQLGLANELRTEVAHVYFMPKHLLVNPQSSNPPSLAKAIVKTFFVKKMPQGKFSLGH